MAMGAHADATASSYICMLILFFFCLLCIINLFLEGGLALNHIQRSFIMLDSLSEHSSYTVLSSKHSLAVYIKQDSNSKALLIIFSPV